MDLRSQLGTLSSYSEYADAHPGFDADEPHRGFDDGETHAPSSNEDPPRPDIVVTGNFSNDLANAYPGDSGSGVFASENDECVGSPREVQNISDDQNESRWELREV